MPKTAKLASSKPAFSLSVQYATKASTAPQRFQFRRWVGAALQQRASVLLRIVDEAEGRALNREYRGKDYATNVLTFAYGEEGGMLCGDIVLCAPVVEREAAEQGKNLADHYAHLTIHGTLHLQGYGHEATADAVIMETREAVILKRFKILDPYLSRND
jgi:probable rRNA maturation factor